MNNMLSAFATFGVPMTISDYTAEDTVILIGRKKRPYHYSPIPREMQDRLLDSSPDYMDRVMGIIYLKDPEKESFIRQDMELQEIRGRKESLDYLASLIDEATDLPGEHNTKAQASPNLTQRKEL